MYQEKTKFFVFSLLLSLALLTSSSPAYAASPRFIKISATTLSTSAPTLSAVPSGTSITLNWVDNSSNENGFTILGTSTNGALSIIAKVKANITTYKITNLKPNTTYRLRVIATAKVGTRTIEAKSQIIRSTTLNGVIPPTPTATQTPFVVATATPGALPTTTHTPVVGNKIPTQLTGLPELKVEEETVGDKVYLKVHRVSGAKDYRVYALPNAADITQDANSVMHISNAIYRCAGVRPGPGSVLNTPGHDGVYSNTYTQGSNYWQTYNRQESDALLGYLFPNPAPGLVPVYVLTNPFEGFGCNEGPNDLAWRKFYTTSSSEASSLIAQGYRDDGVLGYAPDLLISQPGTLKVFEQSVYTGMTARYVENTGEAALRGAGTVKFSVFNKVNPPAGALPLYRVQIVNACINPQDVLALGDGNFEVAKNPNGQVPADELTWSGLTKDTQLVVEAIDSLCPTQGAFNANSAPAVSYQCGNDPHATVNPGYIISNDASLNISELQNQSTFKEGFINGLGHPSNNPKALARAIFPVSPQPSTHEDFLADFRPGSASEQEIFTYVSNPEFNSYTFTSQNFKTHLYGILGTFSLKAWAGELWVRFSDWCADTGGKLRITAKTPATISDNSFIHVQFDTSELVSSRRYAQIIISDSLSEVQDNFIKSNSLIIENLGDWPAVTSVQVCDHRNWEVNSQCPGTDAMQDVTISGKTAHLPFNNISDHIGFDKTRRYEAYVSTKRVFVFMDGDPYMCVDLPSAGVPKAGPVSVTFGGALYHSGADKYNLDFMNNSYYQNTSAPIENRTRIDKMSFSSNQSAPTWDFNKFPCLNKIQ